MTENPQLRWFLNWFVIKNQFVFLGLSAALISYILYMMIRRRKGERLGKNDIEPEI